MTPELEQAVHRLIEAMTVLYGRLQLSLIRVDALVARADVERAMDACWHAINILRDLDRELRNGR